MPQNGAGAAGDEQVQAIGNGDAEVVAPPPPMADELPDLLHVRRRTFLGPLVRAGSANTPEWRRAAR
ncbi:hypothetical protein BJF84_11465 [Rhodococcus sp. CUA-806]|nr:hypothetical protein BJF84_11465 [Rhodococcus sp. CUA-806]